MTLQIAVTLCYLLTLIVSWGVFTRLHYRRSVLILAKWFLISQAVYFMILSWLIFRQNFGWLSSILSAACLIGASISLFTVHWVIAYQRRLRGGHRG